MSDKFEDIDKAFVKWRNEKPRWQYNTTECLHTWRHGWQASRAQAIEDVVELVSDRGILICRCGNADTPPYHESDLCYCGEKLESLIHRIEKMGW